MLSYHQMVLLLHTTYKTHIVVRIIFTIFVNEILVLWSMKIVNKFLLIYLFDDTMKQNISWVVLHIFSIFTYILFLFSVALFTQKSLSKRRIFESWPKRLEISIGKVKWGSYLNGKTLKIKVRLWCIKDLNFQHKYLAFKEVRL